jgi:hypothetical protein
VIKLEKIIVHKWGKESEFRKQKLNQFYIAVLTDLQYTETNTKNKILTSIIFTGKYRKLELRKF